MTKAKCRTKIKTRITKLSNPDIQASGCGLSSGRWHLGLIGMGLKTTVSRMASYSSLALRLK